MQEFNISTIVSQLGTPLKRKRKQLGLSLSEVEELLGISSSTLSRIERKIGKPDVGTIQILADWLEIPFTRIFRDDLRTVFSPNRPLPVVVTEQLQNDETLSPQGKEFLSTFFSQTYQQFLKIERKKRKGEKNAHSSM